MPTEWGPDYLMAEHLLGTQAYGLWQDDECVDVIIVPEERARVSGWRRWVLWFVSRVRRT